MRGGGATWLCSIAACNEAVGKARDDACAISGEATANNGAVFSLVKPGLTPSLGPLLFAIAVGCGSLAVKEV